jgi:hypothetical protein
MTDINKMRAVLIYWIVVRALVEAFLALVTALAGLRLRWAGMWQ